MTLRERTRILRRSEWLSKSKKREGGWIPNWIHGGWRQEVGKVEQQAGIMGCADPAAGTAPVESESATSAFDS